MRLFCTLLATLAATSSTPVSTPTIRAEPVPLELGAPARMGLGSLRYLGGWELTSSDTRFGGLSSMVWRDGTLIAVSDAGATFAIDVSGDTPVGRVTGRLPDGPGTGKGKADRDAESLAGGGPDGSLWVGFESRNEIWRYDARLEVVEAHRAPPAMAKWPSNGGPEAMVRLADGRFLVFSEEAPGPQRSTALLVFPGDPTDPANATRLAGYRAPPGYAVTEAAALPDGRLVLLHRRFTLTEGVSAIVSLLDPRTIRPGHAVAGRIIARLVPPLTVDNMEAMAVSTESGRPILWIASDDNFSPLQRTLLLKFMLQR